MKSENILALLRVRGVKAMADYLQTDVDAGILGKALAVARTRELVPADDAKTAKTKTAKTKTAKTKTAKTKRNRATTKRNRATTKTAKTTVKTTDVA